MVAECLFLAVQLNKLYFVAYLLCLGRGLVLPYGAALVTIDYSSPVYDVVSILPPPCANRAFRNVRMCGVSSFIILTLK